MCLNDRFRLWIKTWSASQAVGQSTCAERRFFNRLTVMMIKLLVIDIYILFASLCQAQQSRGPHVLKHKICPISKIMKPTLNHSHILRVLSIEPWA